MTQLPGKAYTFYRTCPAYQRTFYEALTSALTKRFKPVRIKSVLSGLFHERKQQPKKGVDDYAQDLDKLYEKYILQQKEEVRMQRRWVNCFELLTYLQFVAGPKQSCALKWQEVMVLLNNC